MRRGSAEAQVLYKDGSASALRGHLSSYEACVKAIATAKKRPELVSLNAFWMDELPNLDMLSSRQLSDVVKFKLTRGKMRPLQKLADSNSQALVSQVTEKAFTLLRKKGDWVAAIAALSELKGIAAAGASCIAARIRPDLVPFLSDEVCESIIGTRDYSLESLKIVQHACVQKAQALNDVEAGGPHEDDPWTAESVGRALWCCATCVAYDVESVTLEKPESSHPKSTSKSKSKSKSDEGPASKKRRK